MPNTPICLMGWCVVMKLCCGRRLARLAEAKAVLQVQAKEPDAREQAFSAANVQQREEKAQRSGHPPRDRPPEPPTSGSRDKDQYNVTDLDSPIIKHIRTEGFEQDYTTHLAVDPASLLIVGVSVSNHPTDQHQVAPTLDAI